MEAPARQPLPFRPSLQTDEILTSWIARLALRNGYALQPFLAEWCGVKRADDWDIDLERPGFLLEKLSALSGVPRSNLETACLDDDALWVMPLGHAFRSRYRFGMQACPECLASQVAYLRKVWRYAWWLVCPMHLRLMVDSCQCGAPIVPLRQRAHIGRESRLWLCHACLEPLHTGGGAAVDMIAMGSVIALQEYVQRLLSSDARWKDRAEVRRLVWSTTRLLQGHRAVTLRKRAAREVGTAHVSAFSGREREFSAARIGIRFTVFAIAAVWLSDWPKSLERNWRGANCRESELLSALEVL